jgi:hypothetical protein
MTTLTTTNGDLFRIAAEQYGDATFAVQLMEANGTDDWLLPGAPTTVTLPATRASTDGVPNGD